jgi:hypothetical protein
MVLEELRVQAAASVEVSRAELTNAHWGILASAVRDVTGGLAIGLRGFPASIAAFRKRYALRFPLGFNPPPAAW